MYAFSRFINSLLRAWVENIKDAILEVSMAQQVYTITQILRDLNTGKPSNPWFVANGIYSLSGSKIDHTNKTVNGSGESLVTKVFINRETGEIKTYLSKWIDEPETMDLL